MNKNNILPTAYAEQLVLNIGKAAVASNNYPSAWKLWKGWADLIIPEHYWKTEAGTDFLRQVKRNLQNMTVIRQTL